MFIYLLLNDKYNDKEIKMEKAMFYTSVKCYWESGNVWQN